MGNSVFFDLLANDLDAVKTRACSKIGYVLGNEAVQVLKLVLILFVGAFKNFFCLDSNFKRIIYRQLTALEFIRSYSQQSLVEGSEILYNPLKEPPETKYLKY